MRLAFIFGPWSLSFRGSLDFADLWNDPRGLTGSELGILRTAQCAAELGHSVTLYTVSNDTRWGDVTIRPFDARGEDSWDAAISWNEPAVLEPMQARVRVCEQMLNDFTYCTSGFHEHVDLWTSPSKPHLERVTDGPKELQHGATYQPEPDKWHVVPLGCDPERYHGGKVSGRVVYTSSPDRGLHNLLQHWAPIKRAAPHAELHIFYRLKPWLEQWKHLAYWPKARVEEQRARAYYIADALGRLANYGVFSHDSVSRNRIEKELGQAEVMAYPCDPTSWTEGFSCSLLEGCAAQACPVTLAVDALPGVYGDSVAMVPRENMLGWRDLVIRGLTDPQWRAEQNAKGLALAKELTWKRRTQTLLNLIG